MPPVALWSSSLKVQSFPLFSSLKSEGSMKGKNRLRVQERFGQVTHDSYFNKTSPKDRSYCQKCHAIYHNKRWHFDKEELKTLQKYSASKVLCPACQKIEDHFASGVVTLRGPFLKNHREEILNLIKNEEERAKGLNPLERIIDILPNGEIIEVTTTHEKLAQRIGKSLHRAFSGKVAYQWSRGDKMARVSWSRD
jgi:NMD protein affecting ribosome stability and mRNA decay